MKLEGRKIYKGTAEAEAIVTREGISFYGGVDPDDCPEINCPSSVSGDSGISDQ